MDERIEAIRNDVMVGRGSCSSIDECYSDSELLEFINDDNVTTPRKAVAWARRWEGLRVENALNYRWGADDDPQLLAYNEWQENLDKNPIRC